MALLGDRYKLLEPLGKGSFAHTWRAKDTQDGSTVAVKILDPRTSDWKARELFQREASVLAGLRHPGIPAVFGKSDVRWEGADTACLVMEYVEGTSLATVIGERRRMADAEAVTILVDLLGILDYLHTRVPPVVHRDIKPANIILRPEGAPALVDFGCVREGFAGASEPGSTVAGTYGYMPYEQYMGQALPSSDLYALGATMLHLFTGKPPRDFMGAEGRIEVPSELAGGAHLRAVIARMLASSPAERFASARDVQRALAMQQAIVPAAGYALSAPQAGAAVTPAGRRTAPAIVLPATPREFTGVTKERLDKVSYSMWQLMEADEKPSERGGLYDVVVYGFFCVITAGILPMIFYSYARSRRRRAQLFFREGTAAHGTITELHTEKTAFDAPITRVHYEFIADGELHRDADTVLPAIAHRWRVGDTIQLLVIPDRGYDSIIISAE
jgi:hypothetical protein